MGAEKMASFCLETQEACSSIMEEMTSCCLELNETENHKQRAFPSNGDGVDDGVDQFKVVSNKAVVALRSLTFRCTCNPNCSPGSKEDRTFLEEVTDDDSSKRRAHNSICKKMPFYTTARQIVHAIANHDWTRNGLLSIASDSTRSRSGSLLNDVGKTSQCERKLRDALTRVCLDVCGSWACFCAALDFFKRTEVYTKLEDDSIAIDNWKLSVSEAIVVRERNIEEKSNVACLVCLQLLKSILHVGKFQNNVEGKMNSCQKGSNGASTSPFHDYLCFGFLQQLVHDWVVFGSSNTSFENISGFNANGPDCLQNRFISREIHERVENLATILILLPQRISSALAGRLKKPPSWCTRSLYPRLIAGAVFNATLLSPQQTSAETNKNYQKDSILNNQPLLQQLFQSLLYKMVRHGGAADVAQSWYDVWSRLPSTALSCAHDAKVLLETYSGIIHGVLLPSISRISAFASDDREAPEQQQDSVHSAEGRATVFWTNREIGLTLRCVLQLAASTSSKDISVKNSERSPHKVYFLSENSNAIPTSTTDALAFLRDTIPKSIYHDTASKSSFNVHGHDVSIREEFVKQSLLMGASDIRNCDSRCRKEQAFLLASLFHFTSNESGYSKSEIPIPPAFKSVLSYVSLMWSDPLFVNRMSTIQQRLATDYLLCSLSFMNQARTKDSSPIGVSFIEEESWISSLIQGVSSRLESCVQEVRLDGMRIATSLAPLLGQSVKFDELEEHNSRALVDCPSEQDNAEHSPSATGVVAISEDREKMFKGDASFDDFSESDEDDLIPYDLHDDEEDLKGEAQVPVYLRDCLAMLRAQEDDENAMQKHEEALKAVSELVRKRPPDLMDLCLPLGKELLHMENKFDIPNFAELSFDGLTALTVAEPKTLSGLLIGLLFSDSISTGSRIDILDILTASIYELSGAKTLDERRQLRKKHGKHDPYGLVMSVAEKVSGKRRLLPKDLLYLTDGSKQSNDNGLESAMQERRDGAKTRRWGRKCNALVSSVTNEFGSVAASFFFYPLVTAFVASKDHIAIWSRGDGARVMSKLILTLSAIVEGAANYPGNVQVMARDLLSLVWDFRTADSPSVRQAVLVAVATCLLTLRSGDDILKYVVMQLPELPVFLASVASEKKGSTSDSSGELALFVLQNIQQCIQGSMNAIG